MGTIGQTPEWGLRRIVVVGVLIMAFVALIAVVVFPLYAQWSNPYCREEMNVGDLAKTIVVAIFSGSLGVIVTFLFGRKGGTPQS